MFLPSWWYRGKSKVPPIAVFIADFSLHKCLTFCVERNPCKGVICGCMLIKPFFPNFPVRESAIFQRRKRSEVTTVLLQECASNSTNRQNKSNLSRDFVSAWFSILVWTVFHFMVFRWILSKTVSHQARFYGFPAGLLGNCVLVWGAHWLQCILHEYNYSNTLVKCCPYPYYPYSKPLHINHFRSESV